MAATGAMADFARLPPERKALVFIVAGLVIGALYFQFGFKSLNSELEEARTEHEGKLSQLKRLTADGPEYEKLKTHVKELTQAINENQKALPTETELPAFYDLLNRKIGESGVELLRNEKLPEELLEGFVKVPIDIEIQGTFLQLKHFFASLSQKDMAAVHVSNDSGVQEKERIISIENLMLKDPTMKNGVITLDAKFVAATFRQEDKPVAAPGQPGAPAQPGQPGTPPPPGTPPVPNTPPKPPTTAPMPSAGTPAGAKARVEDSLDKGDTRNRNATGVDEAKTTAGGGSGSGGGTDRLKGGM